MTTYSPVIDNITQLNPVLFFIKNHGNIYACNGTSVLQGLATPFVKDANAVDSLTCALFPVRNYAFPIAISGWERLANTTKEALIDLVDSRAELAINTCVNLVCSHVYGDGTGNNGKDFIGLAAMLPSDPTKGVYAGIDRSVFPIWRHKVADASLPLFDSWNKLVDDLTVKVDSEVISSPDVIVCGIDTYTAFEAQLQDNQKLQRLELKDAGFVSLEFRSIPVMLDTNAPANHAYFLTTKHLHLTASESLELPIGDSDMGMVQFRGSLTVDDMTRQGVYIKQ